jgi:hypothetical protein
MLLLPDDQQRDLFADDGGGEGDDDDVSSAVGYATETPADSDDAAIIESAGQTVAGLSEQQVEQAYAAIDGQLQASGVSGPSVQAGLDWLRESVGRTFEPGLRTDGYSGIDLRGFGQDELPMANAFLAAMARRRVPEADVAATLGWYVAQRPAAARQAAAARAAVQSDDRADSLRAVTELRDRYGHAAGDRVAAARRVFADLPQAERQRLERSRDANGVAALNDPDTIERLADRERPRISSAQAADELAEIRKVMATDRRRYNADAKMQARYRHLLAQRGSA